MTNIQMGSVVTVQYRIRVASATEPSETRDIYGEEKTFSFSLGTKLDHMHLFAAFQTALLGKRKGDRFELTLAADEAAGLSDPERMISVPLSELEEAGI